MLPCSIKHACATKIQGEWTTFDFCVQILINRMKPEVVKLTNMCGRHNLTEQVPSTANIQTAISVFIFRIPLLCVIQKNRDTEMTEKTLSLPSLFFRKVVTALQSPPHPISSPHPDTHTHSHTPLSLGSPALGCQMYYRVKRSNVNTESCHGCRVVRPSSSFRPPSLCGQGAEDLARGGREKKEGA